MNLQHTRLLLALVVAFVSFAIAAPGLAAAQETTSSVSEEVLTRFDTESTAQMAADFEAARQREEELEEQIEALEEQGEYGPPRQALREELNEIEDETVQANALGESRYQDIQDFKVEGTKKQRAASLREKAASMMALQRWADSAPLDINSSLYYWGQASDKATEYRAAASALEATAVVPEATVAETTEETTAAAPPGDGGEAEGDPEANPAPANEANEPGASGGSDTGGFGITSLLAAALIFLGVGYYLVGLFREGLGARAKRVGAPQQAHAPKPKSPTASRKESRKAPVDSPGTVTGATEESRGSGSRAASPGTSQGRVTPRTERETGSLDDESLAAWFAQEMSEESDEETKKESQRSERRKKRRGDSGDTPEEARETPKKAPATKPDLNEIVDEQLGAMWEAGELGPMDKVEVRFENGRIVVRKKE